MLRDQKFDSGTEDSESKLVANMLIGAIGRDQRPR